MEPLQKIFDKYARQKEHMMLAYKTMPEDKKDALVEMYIDVIVAAEQHKEYQKLCEKMFEGAGLSR